MQSLKQVLNQQINNITVYSCNGTCSKCGNCCTNFLPVTKKEVSKIKQYVKENDIQPENRKFGNDIVMQCPFFNQKTKRCNIYEVRPFVCRDFLCSHKDWQKRRQLYMQRADFNGMDKKGKVLAVYSMDELIFNNIEFFFYYIQDMCRALGGLTKENFELVIKFSKREEILKYIKYEFEEGKEDARL